MMDTFITLGMILCCILIGYAAIIPVFVLIKVFKTEKIKTLETKFELEKAKIRDDKQKEIDELNDLFIEQNRVFTEQANTMKDDYDTSISHIHFSELTYDQVNQIVDDTFNDIWLNKYFMNYTLREIVIIPDMDNEIAHIAREVYDALGDNVKHNIMKYYRMEYFIQKITRRATLVCMDYIKQNKPPIK